MKHIFDIDERIHDLRYHDVCHVLFHIKVFKQQECCEGQQYWKRQECRNYPFRPDIYMVQQQHGCMNKTRHIHD